MPNILDLDELPNLDDFIGGLEDLETYHVNYWTTRSPPRSKISKKPKKDGFKYPEKEYPVKYGVEMEFESNKGYDYNDIVYLLAENGFKNVRVTYDGSLSEEGFEIISPPLDNISDILEFLEGVTDLLISKGYEIIEGQTCAIHIHVSNVRNVVNLFSLGTFYSGVFEHIRQSHHNQLIHRPSSWPSIEHVEKVCKYNRKNVIMEYSKSSIIQMAKIGYDPLIVLKSAHVSDAFMRSRRCTIRYSGWDSPNKTMEFRIFPHKFNKDLYKIYVKVVGNLINYANKKPDGELFHELYNKDINGTSDIRDRFDSFNQIVGLDADQINILYNGNIINEEVFNVNDSIQSLPRTIRSNIRLVNRALRNYRYLYLPDHENHNSYVLLKLPDGVQVFEIGGSGDCDNLHNHNGTMPSSSAYTMLPNGRRFYIPWTIVSNICYNESISMVEIYLEGVNRPIILNRDDYGRATLGSPTRFGHGNPTIRSFLVQNSHFQPPDL